MKPVLRSILLASCAVACLAVPLSAAQARVFIGGGVVVGGPAYYYPPYYGYAYAPQPTYVYAPPAYAPPAPLPAQTTSGYCREYSHNVLVDGVSKPAYGTACQQPDGTWRIVN